jgi:hypothetical protein
MSKRKESEVAWVVGSRVQVLWVLDEDTLTYFSASVTSQDEKSGEYTILYDEVSDEMKASEAKVILIDQNSLKVASEGCVMKWRAEAPPVADQIDIENLQCPNGHVMTRDLTSVDMRTCECCLSCYKSTNGQWECGDAACDDWGACDACVVTRMKVGHWPLAEEVTEEADQVVTLSEAIEEIGEAVASEVSEAADEIQKMPFLKQSMLAQGYRQFLDTMVKGVTDLVKEKGEGYVITRADVARIAENLPPLNSNLE